MAEIVETNDFMNDKHNEYASKATGNAGLTLGIIGTSLAGLTALGGMAGASKLLGGTSTSSNGTQTSCVNSEELYLERKQANDMLLTQKEMYENKLVGQQRLADAFFDAYKRDIDNSFGLYKNQRDLFDAVQKEQHDNYDILNQKIIDSSFGLYKNQRDEKDAIIASQYAMKDSLTNKINELQSKVDVMAAVRPYQDALINAKIDKNALLADYHLSKRTCRMIEGQLVLPDNLVSGFTSYNYSTFQ